MRELILASAYFCLALGAMLISRETGNIATFWPPNAIAVAVFARNDGVNLGRGVFFCALANIAANLAVGTQVHLSLWLAAANIAEILGCLFLARLVLLQVFEHTQTLGFLVGISSWVFGPILATSAFAAFGVNQFTGAPFGEVMFRWWAAGAIGMLVFFGPVYLFKRSLITGLSLGQWLELSILCALIVILNQSSALQKDIFALEIQSPLFLWCAFRFNALILCLFCVFATLWGLLEILLLTSAFPNSDAMASTLIIEYQMVMTSMLLMARILSHSLAALRESKEQASRKAADLVRTNEDMSTLLHVVSHDLKSPLMTIQGFAGLLRLHLENDQSEKAQHAAARIQDGASTLAALIDDTLELSRMKRNKFANRALKLADLVHDIQQLLDAKIKSKGATIKLEGGTNLFFGDRSKIMRAIMNLIDNALNYGCPKPGMTITVGMHVVDGWTKFYVRDEGPGIEPKDQDRLFDLFFRGEKTGEGTGAGLAIVKKSAERHGGSVWVDSQPNQGATFWFEIPQKPLKFGVD